MRSLSPLALNVYELIARRFLSIFYPPAVYRRYALEMEADREHFFAAFRVLLDAGYLKVADVSHFRKKESGAPGKEKAPKGDPDKGNEKEESELNSKNQEDPRFIAML